MREGGGESEKTQKTKRKTRNRWPKWLQSKLGTNSGG